MIKPEIPENCRTGKREKLMKKKTVHIISHSHWDREWYQSFESHRMKLIELVDNILDKVENDPEFGGFLTKIPAFTASTWMVRPSCWTTIWKSVRKKEKSC